MSDTGRTDSGRTQRDPAQNAQLALLLEVAGTPKPGNVDRARNLPGLRFEHFLAGAVGAGEGLRMAASGDPIGEAFERAVFGMSRQRGGNTQFGALLLLIPLVRASATDRLSPEGVTEVVRETTVADAKDFYRAFDHVDVFVDDPPPGADELDVREGSAAIDAVEEGALTMYDVLALGADADDVAREWTTGFERSFWSATAIDEGRGPLPARGAATYLALLSRRPDTLVAKKHGPKVARQVMVRAQAAREGDPELLEAFADALVEEGINPGTTADIVAAGLFVALERGASV